MTGSLTGRCALVTGGANGIGAAVVDRLAGLGARGVVLDLPPALHNSANSDRSDDPARPVGPWPGVGADVSDEDSVRTAFDAAIETCGRLDIVVAAAGIVPPWHPTAELDLAELDRVMAVNVRGVAATLKHAARVLRPGSSIVVIGSLNSWRGDANIAAYAAAKHAVLGLVRSAALDLGGQGIRVNAVAPGPIATRALRQRMADRSGHTGLSVDHALTAAANGTALGRIATADNVADAVCFLAGDASGATTGHLLPVDGGIL